VALSSAVTVTLDEPIDPATVTASTVSLRDGSGTAVAANVNYDMSPGLGGARGDGDQPHGQHHRHHQRSDEGGDDHRRSDPVARPGGAGVPAVVSYSATTRRATLNPDPTLAADRVWSFTTR
jgi:hypothetical protein